MKDNNIYWRKQKIQTILEDHPEITPDIIKDIPSIVENPVIVMKSLTRDDSITLFGDLEVNGMPVMVALQLNPVGTGKIEADFTLISSAYTKKQTGSKHLIEDSEILYLAEKKRAETLLMSLRVQFPSDQQAYDSLYGSISHEGKNVNISGKKIFSSGTIKPDAKKSKADADFESFSAEDFFYEAEREKRLAEMDLKNMLPNREKSESADKAPKRKNLTETKFEKSQIRGEITAAIDAVLAEHLDFGEDFGRLIGKGRQESAKRFFA